METVDKLDVGFNLSTVEVLQFLLNSMPSPGTKYEAFYFNIQVEHKIDTTNKNIHVLIHTNIYSKEGNDIENELGKVSVVCIYQIEKFDEIHNIIDGLIQLPNDLIIAINSISISTTRGIMYQLFKGTYIHAALLPLIDPKAMQLQPKE